MGGACMGEGQGCGSVAMIVAAVVAVVSLGGSIFFLVEAVGLLAAQPPRVTASIMSAIVGLALLSAATTIARVLLLARAASRG